MCAQVLSTLNLVVGLDDFSQRRDKDESFSPCFITFSIFALCCSGVIRTHPMYWTSRFLYSSQNSYSLCTTTVTFGVLFLLLFNQLKHFGVKLWPFELSVANLILQHTIDWFIGVCCIGTWWTAQTSTGMDRTDRRWAKQLSLMGYKPLVEIRTYCIPLGFQLAMKLFQFGN